ncbi:hypothetical protein CU648_02605 [Bacillus sp. HBCD-sjtu]|uniref:Uncharacterized protein n=1 Tax=Bacillus thuringiensis TaxID=1428 RepID=A0A4Y8TD70_BACTU|nr:hypothetical protein CU648_02605 [Bacillus sp. HBCD-sjtu]KAA2397057.1 hypothetical protein F2Y18_14305 [Bacillus cereus]RSC65404.1 hypothetical protein EGS86_27200 [Bacillus sp. (in: firmicutes)]TFF48811.1 hypothetical protein EQ803_03475 [Bacillus thuringiensis]
MIPPHFQLPLYYSNLSEKVVITLKKKMLRPELFIQIVQRSDFNESTFSPMFPLTLHKYRTVIFK